jgi:hypothetical protein
VQVRFRKVRVLQRTRLTQSYWLRPWQERNAAAALLATADRPMSRDPRHIRRAAEGIFANGPRGGPWLPR